MEKEPKIPFTISEAKKKEGRYCCAYACSNRANVKKYHEEEKDNDCPF